MWGTVLLKAKATAIWLRPAFVREDESYPTLYYRYSHDIAHVLGLRVLGRYALEGKVKTRWWLMFVNALVIFAPVVAGIIACTMDNSTSIQAATSIGWIVYFSCLAIIVQLCSIGGVHVFHNLTPNLEQCLTRKGMASYEKWASISTALFPQLIWHVTWSALGCLALFLVTREPAIAEVLHVTWASYVSIAVSVFYLAGGIWWILAGSVLSLFLTRDGCMKLLPYAPAMTPGIESLVRCYRLVFVGACIGAILCLIPILSWTSILPTSPIALGTALGLIIVSFLALIAVAILPDWMISNAILRERHRVLVSINARLPQSPYSAESANSYEDFLLVWMQTLTATPRGTMSASVIVTIVAALVSSTLPLAISRFFFP